MLPFHGYGKSMSPTTSSESYTLDRKVKKPLMEKYRRKRINDSLDSLRDFVLTYDQQQRQGVKRQLEKADILERTVECLKRIAPAKPYPTDMQQAFEKGKKESFDEGFSSASRAVFEYLAMTMPPICSSLSHQHFQLGLINHLRVVMQRNAAHFIQYCPASPQSKDSSPSPSDSVEPPRKRPWQPWN